MSSNAADWWSPVHPGVAGLLPRTSGELAYPQRRDAALDRGVGRPVRAAGEPAFLATTEVDPLTGLPGRLQLMARLQLTADRGGVLLFLDIDHFEDINRRHGYHAGDAVLTEFVHRLQSVSRPQDFLARLGGDEFALLTTGDLSRGAADALAQRIIAATRSGFALPAPPLGVADEMVAADRGRRRRIGVDLSIGIAGADADPLDRVNPAHESMLLRAELAVRHAKADGGGRALHFEAGMLEQTRPPVHPDQDLESRLRAALRSNALTLHYQPIVDLPSGRAVGAEALARWHDPELGPIPPDRFITLAERTGLILSLGRWVLERACQDAAEWPQTAAGGWPTVTVNISPVQLAESSITDQVRQALRRSGLPADRLMLEITETAAIDDLEQCAQRLQELREIGVRLALDDYGTGHSSLTMLRRLPVDLVKIDRSFVERVALSARDAVLVRLVIDTAHSFGLRVCAEGIEHAEQAHQLIAMGADRAQGWLFGRPQPASAELSAVLAGRCQTVDIDTATQPRLVLGGSDELVLVASPDLKIRYVSATCVTMLGWAPSEVVGTSLARYITLDGTGSDGAIDHRDRPYGSGRYRARHKDGSHRWLETNAQVISGEQGDAVEILFTSKDVTAAVDAKRALQESEAKFREAFDGAPIGMALNALDGSFLRVNHAFAELLGYTTEQVLSLRVADMTHPDDRPADVANTDDLLAGTVRRVAVDKRYLHADGTEVPVRVWASIVRDEQAGQVYIVAHIMPR